MPLLCLTSIASKIIALSINQFKVKGFSDSLITPTGIGGVMLTDHQGNKLVLDDIIHAPEQDAPIPSFTKLRRLGFEIHFLNGNDFLLSSNETPFKLPGRAINDILYVTECPHSLQNAHCIDQKPKQKRKRSLSENENGDEVHEPAIDLSASPPQEVPIPASGAFESDMPA